MPHCLRRGGMASLLGGLGDRFPQENNSFLVKAPPLAAGIFYLAFAYLPIPMARLSFTLSSFTTVLRSMCLACTSAWNSPTSGFATIVSSVFQSGPSSSMTIATSEPLLSTACEGFFAIVPMIPNFLLSHAIFTVCSPYLSLAANSEQHHELTREHYTRAGFSTWQNRYWQHFQVTHSSAPPFRIVAT